MTTRNAPCGWDPDLTICTSGPCCPDIGGLPAPVQQTIKDVAAMTLWALAGRRHGCCPVTVRPCKPDECDLSLTDIIFWNRDLPGRDNLGVGFMPILDGGRVFNIACGCVDICSCVADCEVFLPGPVCSITEVIVDGVVVPPASYTVYDHHKLVFLPPFPCPGQQDYNVAAGQVGSWTVEYTIGEELPPGANMMAGLYACELGKALVNDASCGLPARVQNVARQGVDVAFVDPFALADAGLTGLPVVDLWLRALNPYKMAQRPRIWSPDLPIVRREA